MADQSAETRAAQVFARLMAATPEPRTELAFTDPFTLVVAVALSAQTTDKAVNRATATLFKAAPTPQAMLALGEDGVMAHIASLGLFRSKARNVIALSRRILEAYGGATPLTREGLQSLPGVGRKTASVVLNELGVEPAIAVDTHVFRVARRLGLSTSSTPDKVEADLMRVTPAPFLRRAHHWLILHGRYVCTARNPQCHACPVADLCPSAGLFGAKPTAPRRGGRRAGA